MVPSVEGQIDRPISEGAFKRLRQVLEAGELPVSRSAAERLSAIAQYFVDMAAHRLTPSRPRPKLRKQRRRKKDPPNERLILRRGAPANREMRELFGNLVGFWLDHANATPGVSFDGINDTYLGRFVRFSQAFGDVMVVDLETIGNHSKFASDLREVTKHAVRVRTWLRALQVPQLATRLAPNK
jgi:hypothetical protein